MKKLILISVLMSTCIFVFGQSYPRMNVWDGVAYAVKDYFAKYANDPKSIKYEEASPLMKFNNGKFSQRVVVRGKNSFNATVLQEKFFIITGKGMDAVVESVYTKTEFERYLTTNRIEIVLRYNADGTIR